MGALPEWRIRRRPTPAAPPRGRNSSPISKIRRRNAARRPTGREQIPEIDAACQHWDESGCSGRPTAFVIRLVGYSPDELRAIEEYLSVFNATSIIAQCAQVLPNIGTKPGQMSHASIAMSDQMNSNGQITFAANTFMINKVTTR
jgi:hypothetical protein